MTLVFIDSFDHYATADILTKYSTIFSDPEIGAYGRNGTNGMRNDATDSFVVSIPASQTYIWGIAFKVTVVVTQDEPFFYILDDASAQCSVWLNAAGGIEFRRGTTTDLAVSDPGVIPTDQWLFMEISLTVDNSAGAFELKLDETTIFSDSSVDTQTTANAYLNGLRPIGSVNYVQWDDFYVLNTSGSAPQNTFLGDVRASSFFPTGAGNSVQWQVTGTANNWDAVNEASPNTTDYVYATGSSLIDTHVMEDMGISLGTIFGLQTVLYARKDDAGAVTVHPSLRIGGANYTGTSANLGDSYTYHLGIEEENPDTSSAWTVTGINSLEYGYTRSA